MKNNFLNFFPIACLFAFAAMVSCGEKKDRSKEVSQLDSLSKEMDELAVSLETPDSFPAMSDSIGAHLKYVQMNFVGAMNREMAKTMAEYATQKKIAGEIVKNKAKLLSERDNEKTRILNLKQALEEGATHDAAGNEMTDQYVASAVKTEMENTQNLIRQINLLVDQGNDARSKFVGYYPKIKFWMDSIPMRNNKK